MRYPDASRMRYPDASKAWDPRAKPARAGGIVARALAPAAAAASGQLPPPANAAGAAGNSPLQVAQAALVVGEPIPVIWGRRRGVVGGVLTFPKATEARFENNATTVTSRYHMVLGDGRLPDIQRRDVRLGECRIGTFSQNYNQRAGSWTPGNFATAQPAYTVPTFPTFTGGGGNYQGLSTFEAGATFTGGSDNWRTGWNIFLRGGTIVERGRLLDSAVGSSDNIADLVLWALERSGRAPDALIDLPSLTAAARFTEANGLWCNGEFRDSTNLGDWLIRLLPDFLLRETKIGGKLGLRPLVPVNSDGTINTEAITPDWVLTEAAIISESLDLDFSGAASLRPVPMAMIWRQQHDAADVPIVRTLTVGGPNTPGPIEQHDLSQFATTENHAAKVGAYRHARRTLSTHTATVKLKPGNQSGQIVEGDVVQIYLQVITSREPAGIFNQWYVVESIGHALSGEETLSLSHLPVNISGQNLIALAVAAATGPGQILNSNRTGSSCDISGADSDTTVPSRTTSGTPITNQGPGGSYWAAGGQFVDLWGGAGAPSNSPPPPGFAGAARLAGAPSVIPPSSGTNGLGGDANCPNGYAIISGYVESAFVYGPANADNGGGFTFTATSFPMVVAEPEFELPNIYVFRFKPFRVSWQDPVLGGQSQVAYGVVDTRNPPLVSEIAFKIIANSYSCKLSDGSTNPTPGPGRLYRVMEGDSMAKISQKVYGTTLRADDIRNANQWLMGLDNWGLWPGAVLAIPT